MRKRIMAAAALLGLGACLENPGVDKGLENKHNLASSEFDLDGSSVRVRLERKGGETRLYLKNLNQVDLDSLEFAIQVCPDGPMNQIVRPDYFGLEQPSYCTDPISESHGLAIRLPGGSEEDLGPLAGDFPEELDRVGIAFVPLRDTRYSSRFGSDRFGYYKGAWAESQVKVAPRGGSLSGFILRDGSFDLMLRDGGYFYGAVRGTLAGDSLIDGYYMTGWEYHQAEALRDANNSPSLLRPAAGSPDSLGLTIRFIYHFLPLLPDTLDLRISLARSPGLVWP